MGELTGVGRQICPVSMGKDEGWCFFFRWKREKFHCFAGDQCQGNLSRYKTVNEKGAQIYILVC